MNFLKRFSTIGNRTLARTMAKEMVELYIRTKKENPKSTEDETLKKTLGHLNSKAAQKLLNTESFWEDNETRNLGTIIYIVVTDSSPMNEKRLFIPQNNVDVYIDEIQKVLNEYGLTNE
ncbi:MAG: hypothetical protein M3Q24_02175 [bacterium]|nr:hypothetical protein [bacterium]